MTQKPEKAPSTAVTTRPPELEQSLLEKAQTPAERALAFELLSRVRQSQMIREASAAVAEHGWGKDISPVARAAVCRYCLELGADPVRHVFILGGSVYLNAEFWRDLVAANPKFLRDEQIEALMQRPDTNLLRVQAGPVLDRAIVEPAALVAVDKQNHARQRVGQQAHPRFRNTRRFRSMAAARGFLAELGADPV